MTGFIVFVGPASSKLRLMLVALTIAKTKVKRINVLVKRMFVLLKSSKYFELIVGKIRMGKHEKRDQNTLYVLF